MNNSFLNLHAKPAEVNDWPLQCKQFLNSDASTQRHHRHVVVRIFQQGVNHEELFDGEICRLPAALADTPDFDQRDRVFVEVEQLI